jgi:hypothetical protein
MVVVVVIVVFTFDVLFAFVIVFAYVVVIVVVSSVIVVGIFGFEPVITEVKIKLQFLYFLKIYFELVISFIP